MNQTSRSRSSRANRASWIAAGFIGAFAASIATVIYTGLNVEGSRAEFDAGFRAVTLAVGDRREVELLFESDARHDEAVLEITLPAAASLRVPAQTGASRSTVALAAGQNSIPVEIEGVAPGSGYLAARVTVDGEVMGIYRVFVTVTGGE